MYILVAQGKIRQRNSVQQGQVKYMSPSRLIEENMIFQKHYFLIN